MKKIILTLVSIVAGCCAYAQTNIFPTTGNVGIGTTSPAANLHLLKTAEQLRLGYDASNYTSFTTTSNGSLNIGLNSGSNNLLSIDFLGGGVTSPQLRLFKNTPTAAGSFAIYQGPNGDPSLGAQDYFAANGSSYLNALAGNLTVGKPGGGLSKVSVAGNLAIGSTYYNTTAAPADGLLVQGNVGIGVGTNLTPYLLNIGSSLTRGTVGIVGGVSAPPSITFVDSQPSGVGYSIYSGSSVPGFQIFDQTNTAYRFMIDPNGKVSIGNVFNPAGLLSLNNQISIGTDPINYTATTGVFGQTVFNSYYAANTDGYGPYPRYLDIASVGSPDGTNGGGNIRFLTNPFTTSSPAVERMRIASNGTVFIGTPISFSSTYLLNVNGFVRANEVVVNTSGADFVFKPSYKLYPLSDLKKYIDRNHHLPEIASAKQMQAEGIKVGENEVKLLQKVEELTLYLIDADKKDKELESQIKGQNQKILDQEQRIKSLETKLDQLLTK